MAWKPKEKQLTPEEAVELARRELAPFWIGGPPLLAGVRGADGKATAHPLDPVFDKRAWLILFADLMEFSGEAVLQYAKEWMKRYVTPELGLLLVVRPSYSFLTSAGDLKVVLRKVADAFQVALDHEGLITEAFGGARQALPSVKLLHKRRVLFDRSGADWENGVEQEIQSFLRLKDPGLPLAPPYDLKGQVPRDEAKAELGSRERSALFKFTGRVQQASDHVLIQDPQATIRFTSPHSRLSLVARSAITHQEVSRMRVELNGDTVFEAVTAADLSFGDDGGSEIKVTEGRLYHVLQSLPAKAREITLKFPDADRLPIALYGARFS